MISFQNQVICSKIIKRGLYFIQIMIKIVGIKLIVLFNLIITKLSHKQLYNKSTQGLILSINQDKIKL